MPLLAYLDLSCFARLENIESTYIERIMSEYFT